MTTFTKPKDIKKDYENVTKQYNFLFKEFRKWYGRSTKNQQVEEYLFHGYLRRLIKLKECIVIIHKNCPPNRKEKLTDEEHTHTEIALQTFFINMYGILDNLAWIWNYYKELDINKNKVGLFKSDIKITFSQAMQELLEERKDWFDNLKNFRDSLAHRIPVYIPTQQMTDEDKEEYEKLEKQKREIFEEWDEINQKDFEEKQKYNSFFDGSELHDFDKHDEFQRQLDEIRRKQHDLGSFCHLATHSFSENSPQIYFQVQIISDWKTLIEITKAFLKELNYNEM